MAEQTGGAASVWPAPDSDESATSSDTGEQLEPSELDPYDYKDIADRFYACEIEEIPSFRWMTPSQREVGPSQSVDLGDDRVMEKLVKPNHWSCKQSGKSSLFENLGAIPKFSSLKCFAFKDLRLATRNFKHHYDFGKRGFGGVFKGWIDGQTFTAVKPGTGRIIAVRSLSLESIERQEQWLNEIKYLSRLCHPNIVRLIGYCFEDEHDMLVYEFTRKGSLDNHLFRGSHSNELSWNLRMKIALGAAKGLAFLHNLMPKVVHGDFKTADILLDTNFAARLSNFRFSRDESRSNGSNNVHASIMGACGYAAPEYIATGRLTISCDVYSFGVVLLELLTGRRALDENRPFVEQKLAQWAISALRDERRLIEALDPSFDGRYPLSWAQKTAALALRCVSASPESRPRMDDVVSTLEQLQDVK